jgi:hypothetical protein
MKRIIFIATMTIALSGCQGCHQIPVPEPTPVTADTTGIHTDTTGIHSDQTIINRIK